MQAEGLTRRRICRSGIALVSAAICRQPARAADTVDPLDLVLLETATWGVSTSSYAHLKALGRERWLAGQLHPPAETRLPPEIQAQVDARPGAGQPLLSALRDQDEQSRAANAQSDPETRKATQQAYQTLLSDQARGSASALILRAVYGPDQLRQKVSWFWLNHFSVHQGKANLRATVGDYMDSAIRPHALGRFRDLLEATLRHHAMLRYLDNADNAAGRPNENYARELMELHTMGVGSGYSQADVEALARILTGAGLDIRPEEPKLKPELRADLVREGAFIFNPARHDYGDKVLLGQEIKGGGYREIQSALDILARHPATARRISRQLATFLLGTDPPDAIVEPMAATFTRTDGQIAEVLRTLLTAPGLVAARRASFKPPVGYVISAIRLAYDERPILNAGPILGWLYRLGQAPFNHGTPDGYPLASAAWNGPGQMATRFEVARQIGSGPAGLFKPAGAGAVDKPGFPVIQNELYFAVLRGRLGEATRAGLDQAVSPQDWNTLFLASPEFMR